MKEKLSVRIRNEFRKIGVMNFREKREYIWEYYKLPILGTLFTLFVLGSLINTWFINPPPDDYLVVAWSGGYETMENMEALQTDLSVLVSDPESEAVSVQSFLTNNDPSYDMALGQRMVAMVSTGGLDVFLLDAVSVEGMAAEGMIQPVEGFLDMAYGYDPALREQLSDKLTEAPYVPPGEETAAGTRTFGVNIKGCPLFTRLGMIEQDLYFCVCSTSTRLDAAARALALLYA